MLPHHMKHKIQASTAASRETQIQTHDPVEPPNQTTVALWHFAVSQPESELEPMMTV